MANKLVTTFTVIILAILLILGITALTSYYENLPERLSQHETILVGQDQFTPGSQAALRVLVRDSRDASPLAGAQVAVSLRPKGGGKGVNIYSGKTDSSGSADIAFHVPDVDSSWPVQAGQELVVETKSRLGSDTITRPVSIRRDYRVLLTTDKPLYQPGQVIHVRLLALSTFDLLPAAGQELALTIADGKGNKVFRQTLTTSEYGAAWTDFQLAAEVNTGAYKLSASLGETTSEKTITVERYVLPKFKLSLSTEKPFYQPGQRVKGTLGAEYFFGKPVGGGQVRLEGFTFDVQRSQAISLDGITDPEGSFEFEFDLPAYLAGSDLEGGQSRFYLQASVTDLAQHTETSSLSLPVSQSALVVDLVPESGLIRPGLENRLYALVSYPDGSPAEADLSLTFYQDNHTVEAHTGPYGLAEIKVTPQSPWQGILVRARDTRGNQVEREFTFEGDHSEESLLLRPERPVYRVGDSAHLDMFATAATGTLYLDIVRDGQTLSTRSLPIANGRASVDLDLTPDLYGTLELHAYKILRSGSIIRDTRLLVVDRAEDLNVDLQPSCPENAGDCSFRPGETAGLDIQVSGQDGSGVPAAVGLSIVDESVFALAEQDPGFAKLYFLLEQQLLEPRFDLHGYSMPDLATFPVEDAGLAAAVETSAQASLSAAAPVGSSFSLEANSRQDRIERANQLRTAYFNRMAKILTGLVFLLPLVVFGLSLWGARRDRSLGSGLALAFGLGFVALLALLAWPLGLDYRWAQSPAQRLEVIFQIAGLQGETLSVVLVFAALFGLIGLAIAAWRRPDRLLGWSLGGLAACVAAVLGLAYAARWSNWSPDDPWRLWVVFALGLLPGAFLLRAGSFLARRRVSAALAALAVSAVLLVAPLSLVTYTANMAPAGGLRLQRGDVRLEGAVVEAPMLAALPAPMATQSAAAVAKGAEVDEAANASPSAAEPPRLRQYFPETMLWIPDAITGPDGTLHLDVPVADSITTWRMTALASSQDGRLGSAVAGLRVFQDFFVDLDLPVALTVGDEISVPVGVFNYLAEEQTVRLELNQESWFELLDEPVKEISIAANDISVVYFRVRALQFGQQSFQVTALGSRLSDAIRKDVRVFPDGKQIPFTSSDRLTPGEKVVERVAIPPEAIPGTQKLLVKVYPGMFSQVVEGLDSILRMPYGCFEQTSSTTYPNVLVLHYLKNSGQASPEAQMKAEEYINLGYQRLATFEVPGGGFSLFGQAPADRMLTAYGLQEFADMSQVYEVDSDLVRRAAEWLLGQQASDGAWDNDQGLVHENTWSSLGDDRLPVTAYIAWSLIEAGFGDDARTQKGLAYIRERQAKAEDAYVLALVANALVAGDLDASGKLDASTQAVLDRLAGIAAQDGSGAYWQSGVATFMGSEGQTGSIETTALAALAFLRSGSHPDLGNAALTFLVRQKDSFGTWYSTQATVLALKALIQSVSAGDVQPDARVTVTLNGGQRRDLVVDGSNYDVVQLVSFDDVLPGAENQVEIVAEGSGSLMYQVAGSYYLPWEALSKHPELAPSGDPVTIEVTYDRTELAVDDTVTVNVTVRLNEPGGKAESALIDLGLPPGFAVQAEDLDGLVARYNDVAPDFTGPTIERYELTGRQILVYASSLSSSQPLQFSYRLRARFPLRAQTPGSSAYDYYNPGVTGDARPLTLVVAP